MESPSPWAPAAGVDSRFSSTLDSHDGLRALRSPPRSSLGMLIERSTSAPPQSSSMNGMPLGKYSYGGGAFGSSQDILDQISHSQPGLTNASDASEEIDISDILGGADPHDDPASSPHLADHFDTFSPFPMGRPYGRSASAVSEGQHSFDDRSSSADSQKHLRISPLDGLGRSQSAAPSIYGAQSKLGPPPGMNLMASHSDSLMHRSQQRPASAGNLRSSASALRPAAKTLMDLIQEDFPNESYSQDQDDLSPERVLTVSGRASLSPSQTDDRAVYSATPVTSNQFHAHKEPTYSNQSPYQPQRQLFIEDPYHQAPPQAADRMLQHQLQDQFSPSPIPQQQLSGALYNDGRSIDTLRIQHQGNTQGSMYQPSQQQPMYLRPPSNSQPPHHSPQFDQQQPQQEGMYFVNGVEQQQPLRVNMQQSSLHHHAPQQRQVQQVVTTASGQTVYISTPMPPDDSSYGYGTGMQFQQGSLGGQPQQAQIIQNIVGNNDQYVSVVPIQNGAYWQGENSNMMPGSVSSVAMVNGQQVTVQRMGGDHGHGQQQQYQGRHSAREPKHAGRGTGAGRGGRHARRTDAKGNPTGSPMLNEFRATKNRDWSMHQIVGYVVEFCQDQNGSRFIQQRLEVKDPDEQQIVVNEVLPAIRRLRNDVFGNYVVQKLLDFGTNDVKAAIRDTLKGEMVQLSFQMYGCRVVQKAFEGLVDEDLPGLLAEFQHNVLSCIHDQNGNHVIQKCIEVVCARLRLRKGGSVTDEHIDFIIRDVLVNAPALSCHPYGCRVLQRILEHCDEGRKFMVLDEIMKSHRKLLDDQYGNYVIQHVLQFGRDIDRDSILAIIVESGLLVLSRQKFASNVVEKLLKYGNSNQRRAIVREMLKKGDDPTVNSKAIPGDHGSSVVLLMVRDAYANYVVQTTLDVVPESEEKRLFLKELSSYADELRQYTFAKHIVAKLQTMTVT